MTDKEVIQVLAAREGWITAKKEIHFMDGPNGEHAAWPRNLAQYLTSKDSLQPVLDKLTHSEWDQLHNRLYALSPCEGLQQRRMAWFCLTIPPRTLAHAIAEAIEECAK